MVGLRAEFELEWVALCCVLWAGDYEVVDRFLVLAALQTDWARYFCDTV